jgi:hypothetical protein
VNEEEEETANVDDEAALSSRRLANVRWAMQGTAKAQEHGG